MSLDLSKELKQTFELATLKRQAMHNLSAKDWKSFQDITKRYDEKRRFEARDYKLHYRQRVQDVTKELIDKAGALKRGFKPRGFGHDGFNASAFQRQAQSQIHAGYDAVISNLQTSELQEKNALMEKAKPARARKQEAKQAFNKAVDRRGGTERRIRRTITN